MDVKYAFQEERYKQRLEVLTLSEEFVKKELPILKSIFDADFWNGIRKQLEILREDRAGTIHPVFHLVLEKDIHNNFIKIKQLDNYLDVIFKHPEVASKEKGYIKEELSSFNRINSLNMLYEINVLGYLLGRFSRDKIQIYPKTIGKRNVDTKINFGERDVYVEITVLGESDFTKENITKALRSGKIISILPEPDEEKDKRRIRSRLREKEKQFLPKKPNVLVLFIVDVAYLSPFGLLERSIEQNPLKNIGLIMEFGRQRLFKSHKDGCDNECFLTEKEKKYMENLFSYENFESLVYSSS